MLLRAIAEHNIDPAQSIMVGDKAADMMAAAAAEIKLKVLIDSQGLVTKLNAYLADQVWSSIKEGCHLLQ
jgi:D-glycero-D-manno-heptose 1,7-bisphosphate phosphatase